MNSEPALGNITIYPVKSLDGVALQKSIMGEGCLLHDREYAMIDEQGHFINGKSNALINSLRSKFDFENETISLKPANDAVWNHFHLHKEKNALEFFLSEYFGKKTSVIQNNTGNFMDIPGIAAVTAVASASLHEVASWFDAGFEEIQRRFRATIEIDNVPAFWDDHLFSEEGKHIEFKIGDVTMFGMSPRERCVVPTRNSQNGEVTHAFPKIFAKQRAASRPEWSTLNDYGHYYFLTVNCYIPVSEIGKTIERGDLVKIIGEKTSV